VSAEKRLAMLEQVIAKGSTDPFHHYARAMELRSLGRLEEALDAFGAVRTRFPAYVPTYLMGGQVAIELDRLEAAREWLEQGLEAARAAGETKAEGELRELLRTLP
jgi:tetratricopeptide (TPR) repeat protein